MNLESSKPITWKGLKVEYWGAFGLILFTAAAFFPVIKAGFLLLHDPEYVTENPVVRQGVTWYGFKWSIFSWDSGQWHPVTWLSHMLDVSIWGLNPTGHHLTNLLLHAANAILVFFLLHKITGRPLLSWLSALIFAIHPVQTESVAWVSSRQDLLSATFLFLAIFAYLRYVSKETPKRYLLVVLFFGLGLMTKFTAMALPLYLLILDYWPLKRVPSGLPWEVDDQTTVHSPQPTVQKPLNLEPALTHPSKAKDLKSALHYLLTEKYLLFSFSFLTLLIAIACVNLAGHWGTGERFPFFIRIANAVISYPSYLLKIVLPTGLTFYYSAGNTQLWLEVVDAIAVLTIVVTVIVYFGRHRPYLSCGSLWFVLGLLPTIGLFQFGSQAYADRFLYVPLLGIVVMAVWGIDDLRISFRLPDKFIVAAASAALLLLLGVACQQAGYWKNTEILVRRGIGLNASNAFAQNLLGIVLEKQGKNEEARQQYLSASKLNPRFADPLFHLGAIALGKGDNARAINNLKQAADLNPRHYRTLSYLGQAYTAAHNIQAGCESMLQALIVHPSYEAGRMALCKWNAYRGHLSDAVRDYERILEANPTNIEAINNLGILLAFRNRRDEAIQRFQSAILLQPGNVESNNNLGVLWQDKGKIEQAIQHIEKAHQLSPEDAQISYNLGMALHRKSDYENATKYYEEALKFDPAFLIARLQLTQSQSGHNPSEPNKKQLEEISSVNGIWPVMGLKGTTPQPALELAARFLKTGQSLHKKGLLSLAQQHYLAAMQLNPFLPGVHLNLGNVFFEKQDLQRSLNYFTSSLKLKPDDPVAYNSLGLVFVKAKKYDHALAHFSQALKLKPGYMDARNNIQKTLRLKEQALIP